MHLESSNGSVKQRPCVKSFLPPVADTRPPPTRRGLSQHSVRAHPWRPHSRGAGCGSVGWQHIIHGSRKRPAVITCSLPCLFSPSIEDLSVLLPAKPPSSCARHSSRPAGRTPCRRATSCRGFRSDSSTALRTPGQHPRHHNKGRDPRASRNAPA
jgi:hypothetical protein